MAEPTQSLTNATTTDPGESHRFNTGRGMVYMSGTFNPNTRVIVQVRTPDGTWVPLFGGEFAEAGAKRLDLPPFAVARCKVSVTGVSCNVDAWLVG